MLDMGYYRQLLVDLPIRRRDMSFFELGVLMLVVYAIRARGSDRLFGFTSMPGPES